MKPMSRRSSPGQSRATVPQGRHSERARISISLVLALAILMASPVPSLAGLSTALDQVRLKYLARYLNLDGLDHLMGVETVLGDYALVSSYRGLRLIDLNALEPGGTADYVSKVGGVKALNSVTDPSGRFAYVNVQLGGFVVVEIDPIHLSLRVVGAVEEHGVYFEKMFLSGDRLYVAAHSSGIRIYDVSEPASPVEVGSLTRGFEDAFAITVANDLAYVADGAGGLKIVDISDESYPVILAGENPTTAAATAEDVLVFGQYVYVACGGAGVAVYARGEIERLSLHETPIAARQLERVGPHVAVADLRGVELFARQPTGALIRLAGEAGMYRSLGGGTLPENVSFRNWQSVAAWGTDRLVAANWDSVDVYELVHPASDWQADVTASQQRLHFPPAGGSQTVQIRNDGSGLLEIFDIHTEPMFSVTPSSGALQPGESLELTIDYAGGHPGSGLVLIESNDPDESPLPIQVFGETDFLDPGEPVPPFALESWTYDHETDELGHHLFDLEAHRGKFVFLHIFGTW